MDSNMIPVVYAGNTTSPAWAKADTSNSTAANWYDYTSHQWANAVTVTSSTLASYKSAAPGTIIPEADIMSYWVYIPRYAYNVQRYSVENDPTTTQTPWDIKFQKATEAKLTAQANNASGLYTNNVSAANRWQTHPAFTYGSTELNGIWLGKYETGDTWGFCTHDGNANCGVSQVGIARAARARIKPDMSPMTMQRIAYQYQTAQGMLATNNLTAATTRLSVSKDSEWSAATYLSNSRFGIYASYNTTNPSQSPAYYPLEYGDPTPGTTVPSANKVWNNALCNEGRDAGNQCSGSLTTPATSSATALTQTGYGPAGTVAAPTDSFTNAASDAGSRYYTLRGMLASTTHNVYGLYDMAGGVWEYNMSVYTNASGVPYSGSGVLNPTYPCNSGFLFNGGAIFGGGTGNCGAGSNNTDPSININNAAPWNYTAPSGNYVAGAGSRAKSPMLDFYDGGQFTNNHPHTNFNQCDFKSCGGRGLHETLTKKTLSTSDSVASWNGDHSYFVYADYPWSIRGGHVNNGAAAGVWSVSRAYGLGHWYYGWRAVQSKL